MPKSKQKSERQEDRGVRALWSGTITFGLVSIPVNLFPGNRDSRVPLRMLSPEGEPLKREYVGSEDREQLDAAETGRAFEIGKGKYVTVTDDELERLAPEKSRDIDLRVFVSRDEISPLYFDRAYFLTPADKSAKAYRLLAETMESKNRAGVATFVMRGKEYLVAILSERGILRAETLRFADEIRTPGEIGLPKTRKAPAASVRRLSTAIERLAKKTIDTRQMRDEYSEAVMNLIEKKQSRHQNVVQTETESKPPKVVDLMEVLKQSMKQSKKQKRAA